MLELGRPGTPEALEAYYDLRWRLLRAPWGQPRGSERDALEDEALHVTASDDGCLVGIGRLHFIDAGTAQIRYMATLDAHRGRGVGTAVIERLEQLARAQGAHRIVLNARQSAVPFYTKLGYMVTGEAPTLFGTIAHARMEKSLSKTP
jgi:GNAT superfamily N-acetyltransferase